MSDDGSPPFSLAGFAVAVVTVGAATAVGLAVVDVAGSYVGMLLGGLAVGLAVEKRPLLEAGVAAALANLGILAAGSFIGNGALAAVSAFGAIPPTALLTSTVLGFAVSAFGAHFGDDIRDGLTTPVEPSPSGPSGGAAETLTSGVPVWDTADGVRDVAEEAERPDADDSPASRDDTPASRDDTPAPRDRERERSESDTNRSRATDDVELERE